MCWERPTPTDPSWDHPDTTDLILGVREEGQGVIPREWAGTCAGRVRRMRDELRRSWVGLNLPANRIGHLTDWILAAMIARENVLLLGQPGTAKSEIATRTFRLLGLTQAEFDEAELVGLLNDASRNRPLGETWEERRRRQRSLQKYFHYLLSRFTQPEELFGPIEISLLRQGLIARVDFGLLTGPGVRAVFLDEVFKASSAILNTLLTVTNERSYFNMGGMVRSDVVMFLAASNEMPGGFATGAAGVGAGGEDFQTLYAFLDRFALRLEVPLVTAAGPPAASDQARAFDQSFRREARRFVTSHPFAARDPDMPCVNDLLLLGRYAYQAFQPEGAWPAGAADDVPDIPFDQEGDFRAAFLELAADLRGRNTSAAAGRVTWTVSPRKLKALYKIALAHALVCDDRFGTGSHVIRPAADDLMVFALIWDTPGERDALERHIASQVPVFFGSAWRH